MEEEEGNWVAMEMGHLLEDLVAEIFHRKTGYEIYQIKKMFAHPQYPSCWRMWITLSPCQMGKRLFWRLRLQIIMPVITGGWTERKQYR